MLDQAKDIKRVKHAARPLNGIVKRRLGELLVIEVDRSKVNYKGKSFNSLDLFERKALDDLLYLSHVHMGNPRIIYL